MESDDGFAPILAIFYSVFHPTEGTKVIHQVPSGVIVPPSSDDNKINNNLPDSSAFEEPFFDFDVVKNYVIPKPSLCNKLITSKVDKYRVVGFPVNIYGSHYARNSFGFNFCFVFSYESNTTPFEGNIKRIGRMFRALEEQSQLLSKSLKDSHVYYQVHNKANNEMNSLTSPLALQSSPQIIGSNLGEAPTLPAVFDGKNELFGSKFTSKYLRIVDDWDDASRQIVLQKKAPGLDTNTQSKISSIESLIQQIFQDLNSYSECKIPIDASNSVDLKLFPISPPPPQVNPYDVPIALIRLKSLIDPLWDPTMLRIIPFINGINSIAQISELSRANLELTKECVRHLLHYKAVSILDIFQFSNRYFITSSIGNFLRDPEMGRSCQEYVISAKGSFGKIPLKPKLMSDNSKDGNGGIGFTITNSSTKESNDSSSSLASPHLRKGQMINGNKDRPEYQMMSSESSFGNNPYQNFSMQSQGNSQGHGHSHGHSHTDRGKGNLMKITKIMLPSIAILFQLYNSLGNSNSVSQWVNENGKLLENIDIRKFVTFGIRNGIIARIHVYPVIRRTGRAVDEEGVDMGIEISVKRDSRRNKNGVIIEESNTHSNSNGNGKNGNVAENVGVVVGKNKNHKMQLLNASAAPMMARSRTLQALRADKNPKREEEHAINDSDEESSDSDTEDDEESGVAGKGGSGVGEKGFKSPASRDEAADEFVDATEKRRQRRAKRQEQLLRRLMRHNMHMDAICTAMSLSRKDVLVMLAKMDDVDMIEI